MIRVLGRKHIIRHVGADVGAVVLPRHGRLHGLDGRNLGALGDLAVGPGVALDVVGRAVPRPRRAVLEAAVGGAVEVRALGSRRGRVLAPEVVEQLVFFIGPVLIQITETL